MRYELVLEITGTWAVFDLATGSPATLEGRCLAGLSRDEAERLIDQANSFQPSPLPSEHTTPDLDLVINRVITARLTTASTSLDDIMAHLRWLKVDHALGSEELVGKIRRLADLKDFKIAD